MLVSTMLRSKGSRVATIRPDVTVEQITRRLGNERVGALVVCEEDGRVLGIVSERDVVRAIARFGCDAMDKRATDIMTGDVITCTPDDNIGDLMRMMTEHRIRHLPVLQDGTMCGIVSIGDAVKYRVDELQHEAEAMREYIKTG